MCNCLEKVNELMIRERHARILFTTNISTGNSHVQIATETIPCYKKQKYHIIPTYCPFCGEKYIE